MVEIEGYRLSPQQHLLWCLLEAGSPCRAEAVMDLDGVLEPHALLQALSEVVARHEILRTTYRRLPGIQVPMQAIGPAPDGEAWREVDLTSRTAEEQEHEMEALLAGAREPLEAGPACRFWLVRLAPVRSALLVSLPPLAADGRSFENLCNEIGFRYGRLRGHPAEPPGAPMQYADFTEWQHELLEEEGSPGAVFWRERSPQSSSLFPFEIPLPHGPSQPPQSWSARLGSAGLDRLERAAERWSVAPAHVLLTAWKILCGRLTSAPEILVGYLADGRKYEDLADAIGLYARNLPVACRVDDAQRVTDLVSVVSEAVREATAWQEYWDGAEPAPPPPGFAYRVAPPSCRGERLEIALREVRPPAGRLRLRLECVREPGDLLLRLLYDPGRFRPEDVGEMGRAFTALLASLCDAPAEAVVGDLVTGEPWRLQGDRPVPLQATDLAELLVRQAHRQPEAEALVWGGGRMSHGELLGRTARLAARLRAAGVGPEVPVAVFLERSPEMPIALFAVLRAGGAYVVLEPGAPRARLAALLDEVRPAWILTSRGLKGSLPAGAGRVLLIDAESGEVREEAAGAATDIDPSHLAWISFTSGSTGRPKGVPASHGGALNYFGYLLAAWGLGPADTVLQVAAPSFDASVRDLFGPLAAGARVVLPTDREAMDPVALLARIREHGVTCLLSIVPTMLRSLTGAARQSGLAYDSVRLILLSGERLFERDCREAGAVFPAARLVNQYGPTECTMTTTRHPVAPLSEEPDGDEARRGVPVGLPIPGTWICLLDRRLRAVPRNAPGEVFIGGAGLTRGYLGRPDLTAERFVPDPDAAEPGARLYRTGDLARLRPDGSLEYLGRLDDQVKVRGVRVEPGEVEAVLREHGDVQEAAVVAISDAAGDVRLAAYVVLRPGRGDAITALPGFLRERLPGPMVPAAFVPLSALPRTRTGKLDRGALPAPEETPVDAERELDPIEEVIAGIWSSLLGRERIGRHEGFFELGGHSLIATQVVARLREACGVELPLRMMFEAPTVEGLAAWVERALAEGPRCEAPSLAPVPRGGDLPLSFGQERLWFLDQLQPDDASYNIPGPVRLSGRLEVADFARALTEVVRRHEVLRSVFLEQAGRARLEVRAPAPVPLPVVDLGALPAGAREAELRRLVAAEAGRPFSLARGPLLRAALVRLAEQEHAALLTMHHIVSDGWSIGLLVRELSTLYTAFCEGRPSPLPELPIQYADFAAWQRSWLQGEALDEQLAYWRRQLAGSPATLELPADRPRPAAASSRGATERLLLPSSLTGGLRELARAESATLFMVLLAAFQALLARYTGEEDLSIGTPVAGRTNVATEGLIGFFVNTLVLRGDLSGDPSFRELLVRARQVTILAHTHQHLPFEKIVEELQPERTLSRSPLFQVLLALQSVPRDALSLPGLVLEPLATGNVAAKMDLLLLLREIDQRLAGVLEYATDLFDPPRIGRMIGHLAALLTGAVEGPNRRLSELPLLSSAESQQMVLEWNDTRTARRQEVCLHELVAAQAERTPEAIAAVCEGRSLTFRELDRLSNRLANRLRGLGVGPEVLVGVAVDRSVELVVALVAVLKAGGAYVPLDPASPQERLAQMLDDARVAVLLTQQQVLGSFPALQLPVLGLDEAWLALAGQSEEPPISGVDPDNLAYAFFTSGSTGRPKAAMNSHRGIVNRLVWTQAFELTSEDRVLQKTPISFDVSIWELFGPLLTGGRLVLARPGGHQDSAYLVDLIRREEITTVHFVPSMLQVFLGHSGVDACNSVRRVVCSGEALSPELWQRFRSRMGCDLYNLYGPTEASVEVTFWTCQGEGGPLRSVPIGRPIAGTTIQILDRAWQPCPIGIAGELCIGGVAVGRGYLRRPDLTAERFVPDPSGQSPGARVYRSGDLARQAADGNIEYLGRLDHQVKVRGFRVELGEIEALLAEHPAIGQAVATVRERQSGDRWIAAYVVPRAEVPPLTELREHLARRLPAYMIPAAFVTLAELPTTPSGKIDRRALPAPEAVRSGADELAPPRDPIEELLAGLWCELLGLGRVGIRQNFFELGGHSLLATQLISRIRETFGIEISLRCIFDSPTVAGLASRLVEGRQESLSRAPRIVPLLRSGSLPLSFAQQRLWFLDQLDPGNPAYNIPAALRLGGLLRRELLDRTFREVVLRHESLRTTFTMSRGEPEQEIHSDARVPIPLADLRSLAAGHRDREARRLVDEEARHPFDLSRGPLLRLTLLRLADDEHLLLATIHHIVADGWSMSLLVREVVALFNAFAADAPSPLAELPVQYADFARWQREWLRGDVLAAAIEHWTRQLGGVTPVLELPTDRPRPAIRSSRGSVSAFAVPQDLRAALAAFGNRRGCTPFMILLAGFQVLLRRWSHQTDVRVGTPVAGRNRLEIEDLIGFFVNTLVIRGDLAGDPSFGELLRRVREAALDGHVHQDLPFEVLVDALQPERDLSYTPLFQVAFALQNVPRSAYDLSGLRLTRYEVGNRTVKFDLALSLRETEEGLSGQLEYCTDLFDGTTVRRLGSHFLTLLASALRDPEQAVTSLALAPESERHQVLVEWNDTFRPPPAWTAPQRLAEQAAGTPHAIAVRTGGASLSYGELDRRATALAHSLQTGGAGPASRVALLLDRAIEIPIAILAVWKAGGASVPLDPAAPAERLAALLADVEPAVVIHRGPPAVEVGENTRTLDLGALCLPVPAAPVVEESASLPGSRPEGLAYLIYTSGTTGLPKAVMIEHGSLASTLAATIERFGFAPDDRMPLVSRYTFDISLLEMLAPLLAGGTVEILTGDEILEPESLLAAVERATRLHGVPSLLRQVAAGARERGPERFAALRSVLTGGDVVSPELQAQLLAVFPSADLHVLYGPTEAAIICATQRVERGRRPDRSPVGRPLPGVELRVVDPAGRPVALGVPGELWIGGPGVARGYFRRDELTAERFVFTDGRRFYRTGDLVRHLAAEGGTLEFLGRTDDQVKVRGFRIEPGEIEAALATHPGVGEIVVVARPDGAGENRLAAYCVPVGTTGCTAEELRAHAARLLPGYMIPSAFVLMAQLPLTRNGKVDRARLPAPESAAEDVAAEAPATPLEEIMAGVWCEILELPRISRSASFFSLGGDSILSIRVVALAREQGLRVSVAQIFQHQTIAELAQAIDRATDPDLELVPTRPFDLVDRDVRPRLPEDAEDAYPLTRLQAGMLYHMELAPQAPLYHNINSFHLRAPFDARSLQQAVERAVERHPALRTAFDLAGYGEPLQLVYRSARLPVIVEDLRHLAPAEQEAALAAHLAGEAGRRFDLSRPPLLRFFAHRRSEETFQLGFTLCHPILDGWSMELLLTEIFEDYLALASGASPPERPAVSTGMRDFVALELQALRSQEQRDAWNACLNGASALELPRWQAPGTGADHRGEIEVVVPADLSLALLRLARSLALPLKSVLLAGHLRVLSRLADQDDVLTGLIGHGRPTVADADRACGMFLNTLPFRLRLPARSWADLVRDVFTAERALLPVRRFPLAALQREWGDRVMFETVFNYVHYRHAGERPAGGRIAALGSRRLEQTSFPWLAVFQLDPAGERVRGTLRFDEARFPEAQMRSVATLYLRALAAMQQDPDAPHAADPLLSAGELQQILAEWNDTGAGEMPRSLHGLFEEQVARAPEAVAALCEDRAWTYAELDGRASRFARWLQDRGLGRGALVAVCLDRGLEMLEALLGILKAGAAYVPIEPSLPPLRMRWILSTLGIRGAVTGKSTLARMRGIELPGLDHLVCLDAGEEVDGGGREPMRPQPPAGPDDLAYIIFTSGSTGTPKGVMVRHRPVVNLIDWARDTFGFGPSDRVLFVTRLDFDLSVFDIFGLLAVGGSVRIASPADLEEPERLVRRLQTERITFWDSAPAALQQLVPFFSEEPAQEAVLRLVFLSGDWVPLALPGLVRQSFPGARVVALGGATEATVWSNFHRADEIDPGWVSVPYGRPIRNASYHVLDAGLRPQPVGTPGDLYIGGGCLAAGYAGDPSLTAEKFLPDSFGERDGGRLYRTGDRARYWPDGTLEFLGRRDQQVKIRGFRIELGEIEAVLSQHPAIREAVVLAREDEPGQRRLVAYAVAGSAAPVPPATTELREFLRARLPEHMVPAVILLLSGLPLTPNGKVDRRALPAPAEVEVAPAAPCPPRTPLEELLAGLWAEALGRESVGAADGFFDLGGDSLGATRLVSRVRRTCGVELPLRSLFEAPTPAQMAERVEALLRDGEGTAAPPIERVDRRGPLPLSFAQRRMWFIDQLEPGSHAYNLGSAVRLRGPLATPVLESSLAEVVRRQEALRTTFPLVEGDPVQVIAPPGPFHLPVIDLCRLPEAQRQAEAGRLAGVESRRPFDLSAGPLLRVVLLRLGDADHVLQLTLHHIICDGWSIQVLVREITALYEARCSGRPSPLPELPVQYADYACWQREWLRGEVLETKLAYWTRQLAGLPGPLELPGRRSAPAASAPDGGNMELILSDDLLSRLRELARREGATLFMCLLAAYKVLLHRLSGRTDIVVGTDIANRTQGQTENLIGCFFNMLTLRTDLGGHPSFRELLARIREGTLGAYAHQDVPLDKLVEELRPERSLGHSPLFNVLFVLQSTAVEPVRLSALAAEPFSIHNRTSKFDLALFVRADAGRLVASWVYKTELFEARAIADMARRFQVLLESIADAPDARVDMLAMLTPQEEREKTMDLKKREESSFDRFKKVMPKPVSVAPAEVVSFGGMDGNGSLPLVARPNLPGVDLVDWSRENRSRIEQQLFRHGAILFRGFENSTVERFERFATTIALELFDEYGDLPRESGGKVYRSTPYPADKIILFHNESSHQHRWPMKQFFHCVKAAATGGETPIVDCRRVYAALDPEIRHRLADKGLMYVRNFTPTLDVSWEDFFHTSDRAAVEQYCRRNGIDYEWRSDGGLRTRQVSPAVVRHPRTGEHVFFNQIQLHHVACLEPQVRESLSFLFQEEDLPRNVYYGDGSPIEDSVVERISEIYWSTCVEFPWQEGDTLLVDNMLVAHARRGYEGERKIVVAMGEILDKMDLPS